MSSLKSQITKRDFQTHKFDGGARESFQFTKFFQLQIDKAGLSTILSTILQPDAVISMDVAISQADHNRQVEAETQKYLLSLTAWTTAERDWGDRHTEILNELIWTRHRREPLGQL
jgi:hypothetical protein